LQETQEAQEVQVFICHSGFVHGVNLVVGCKKRARDIKISPIPF